MRGSVFHCLKTAPKCAEPAHEMMMGVHKGGGKGSKGTDLSPVARTKADFDSS